MTVHWTEKYQSVVLDCHTVTPRLMQYSVHANSTLRKLLPAGANFKNKNRGNIILRPVGSTWRDRTGAVKVRRRRNSVGRVPYKTYIRHSSCLYRN